jgi:hypothetical protein
MVPYPYLIKILYLLRGKEGTGTVQNNITQVDTLDRVVPFDYSEPFILHTAVGFRLVSTAA